MKTYIIIFIFSAILGSILMFSFTKLTKQKSTQTSFNPEKAPTESLRGKIATFSGIIKWQSRIATEAARVNLPAFIQQGEQIETEDNGKLTIEFPNVSLIKISPDSQINFAQTLPANIVLVQSKGLVQYQKSGKENISIRVLHLLIQQTSGEMIVSISKDRPLITVNIKKGEATIAYNDAANISQEVTINEGKQLIFNDSTREITL